MKIEYIDNGSDFDFGRTSKDYSRYRDIYPDSLYQKVYAAGIGLPRQKVLDLGTGTGVFPRGMYHYGADYYGIDISKEQIREAEELSRKKGMNIHYAVCSAEDVAFPDGYFDSITAVQCFLYFSKDIVLPRIHALLKQGGLFAIAWMAWIPDQSVIAEKTEQLILRYNPKWQGHGYKPVKSEVPEWSKPYFKTRLIENYIVDLAFTVETWSGRIRACRGVAAALPPEQISAFDAEHVKLLESFNQSTFSIPHQILIHVYEKLP